MFFRKRILREQFTRVTPLSVYCERENMKKRVYFGQDGLFFSNSSAMEQVLRQELRKLCVPLKLQPGVA